jgi:hypothetical protein
LANHPKVSAQKRARERARQERQKEKSARRDEARDRKSTTPRVDGGGDPDIEGIVPGPQASPWCDDEPWGAEEEEEETEAEDEPTA